MNKRTFNKDMATEVSQSVTHREPALAYCASCGTRYFVSFLTFEQLRGACSCSWSCCDTARPGNESHARHMATRSATAKDLLDAAAGLLKDFREPLAGTWCDPDKDR